MQINSLTYENSEATFGPTATTELCKRVLFRQSDCKACVDVCPTDAITFTLGPEINENCINCGLCAIACPMETFENTPNTDQMLLDVLRDQADKTSKDHKLYIHCHQADTDNDKSVSVNCLGNMTENALVAMSKNGVQDLMLTTGNCNFCHLSQGKALFKQATTTYSTISKMIFPSVSAEATVIKIREKQKVSQVVATNSRRDFFRSLGNGVAKHAAEVVINKEQQIKALLQSGDESVVQIRPSPRREMLKALLETTYEEADDQPIDNNFSNNFPWKKMHVDVAHCVGCGVCVNVCPTGALTKEVSDMALTRTLNYSLCSNCGVCAEACPQDVIRFEQPYSLANIVTDVEEEVAKVMLNGCIICGEIIPVSEGEVCTTCQKRQVVPMFM